MPALWQCYVVPDAPGLDTISFDQVEGEAHERTAEVTDHPVETGSNIADHVRQNPPTLTLELYLTNTPTNPDTKTGRGQFDSVPLPIPTYDPGLSATPGSVFRAAKQAIVQAINGVKPPIKVQVLDFATPFDRIKETQTALDALMSVGGGCSVVTSLMTYDQMVITRCSMPRKEPGGATFTIDFKNVKTVSTLSVTAPAPLEKRGAPAVSKGAQAPKPVGAKDAQSAAAKLIDYLGSLASGK